MKPIKVKFISTNGFDPDPRVYNQARTLISHGHDAEVLAWDRENRYRDKERESIDGIRVKRFFPRTRYGSGWRQIPGLIRLVFEMRAYLKGKTYDIVHGQDLDGALIGSFLKGDKKLIWDMRELYDGFNHGGLRMKLNHMAAGRCFRNSDGIVLAADYQNERYREKFKPSTLRETILNTAEESIFIGFARKASPKLRISYIGSVRQYDELKMLMDVGKEFEGLEIHINGSGTQVEALKKIAPRYPDVQITGKFSYKETKTFYENSDVIYVVYGKYVINQKYGIPIKGYEAIYTSTPVIAGNDGYFGEFVRAHDIGFTIDSRNPEDLRNVVRNLLSSRNILEEKRRNIDRIKAEYTWQNQSEKLIRFYRKLVSGESDI